MKSRTLAASTAIAAAVTLAPVTSTHANADAIDDTLAKLPQGPISCAQAEKYWTNEADYQNKVRQAQTIARFDSRGPQILEALGRVDEAANRCGLKGGAKPAGSANQNANKPANNANTTNTAPKPAAQKPAPAQPQPNIQLQAPKVNLTPAGMPSFEVPVANVVTLQLPDILKMVIDALAGILNYFNVKVPGINA